MNNGAFTNWCLVGKANGVKCNQKKVSHQHLLSI